jgi:hypothetical protein
MAAVFFTTSSQAIAQTQPTENGLDNIRNKRYCEVITVKRNLIKFDINVYSTVNLNDCPEDLWKQLKENEIKKQFHIDMVKLNGPRYWTLDGLRASKSSIDTPLVTIGGINFKQRATLDPYFWQAMVGNSYTPNSVNRTTVWIYKPYTRIYELVDPHGNIYVMQSYSQIVDPNLQMSDLIDLGSRLKLPKGWKYQTRIITEQLNLKAEGIAYVISDDLLNSYQRE